MADDSSYIFWPNTAPAGTTTVYFYWQNSHIRFGVNASSVPDGVTAHGGMVILNVSSMPTSSSTINIIPFASAVVTATGSTASFGSLNLYSWPDTLSPAPALLNQTPGFADRDGHPAPPPIGGD